MRQMIGLLRDPLGVKDNKRYPEKSEGKQENAHSEDEVHADGEKQTTSDIIPVARAVPALSGRS